MFEALKPPAPDKILSLMGLFRDDPRPYKIDLGVGVYRDARGRTPVMGAVREAERRLYDAEDIVTAIDGLPFHPDSDGAVKQFAAWMTAKAMREIGVMVTGGSSSRIECWPSMNASTSICS